MIQTDSYEKAYIMRRRFDRLARPPAPDPRLELLAANRRLLPRVQYSREVSSGHPDRPVAGVLHAVGGELLGNQVGQF